MKRFVWVLCVGILAMAGMEAAAQIQIGGLLRDEYALALTPSIKSAGMGGAYVGVDRNYSMNPAALGGIEGIEGTLSYGLYDHKKGPTAHRGTLDIAYHEPLTDMIANWLPPAFDFLRTAGSRLMVDGLISDGKGNTKMFDPAGNPYATDFDEVTLGTHFGVDITDWFSVGFGSYPYEKAHVNMTSPTGKLKGDALTQFGSTQIGTLIKPCQYFNIGGEFIYLKDDLEVDGLPAPQTHLGDYYFIHYFGVGASIMPFDGTLIAVDYWNGEMEGAVDNIKKFDQDVDRWNFGIEQRVCKFCDVRLGSNNGGLTTGFTIHINDKMEVDYAYVNQALRDKENVLGDTQYHGLAFTARF